MNFINGTTGASVYPSLLPDPWQGRESDTYLWYYCRDGYTVVVGKFYTNGDGSCDTASQTYSGCPDVVRCGNFDEGRAFNNGAGGWVAGSGATMVSRCSTSGSCSSGTDYYCKYCANCPDTVCNCGETCVGVTSRGSDCYSDCRKCLYVACDPAVGNPDCQSNLCVAGYGSYTSHCCSQADHLWCGTDGDAGGCRYNDGHTCAGNSDCCNGSCIEVASGVKICDCGLYKSDPGQPGSPSATCYSTCSVSGDAIRDATHCVQTAGTDVYCDGGLTKEGKCVTCDLTHHAEVQDGQCEYSCGASLECDEQSPDSAFCTSDCQSRLLDVYLYPVEINPV